jgi:hypothetical protein
MRKNIYLEWKSRGVIRVPIEPSVGVPSTQTTIKNRIFVHGLMITFIIQPLQPKKKQGFKQQ